MTRTWRLGEGGDLSKAMQLGRGKAITWTIPYVLHCDGSEQRAMSFQGGKTCSGRFTNTWHSNTGEKDEKGLVFQACLEGDIRGDGGKAWRGEIVPSGSGLWPELLPPRWKPAR